MNILIGFGIFFGVILLYFTVVIFFPVLTVQKLPLNLNPKDKAAPEMREDVEIDVNGEIVRAWFYSPKKSSAPCVVLCHGFCGTKDMGLENYALKFNKAGYGAIAIDYRHFGYSDGEPRQRYLIMKQLEDIHAAVDYVRKRKEIDEEKIFLWGTSASGNYGILAAAEDELIAGVIGQLPSLDHKADSKLFMKREGMKWILKILVHAQRDKGRSRFGLASHTFPVVGEPGTTCLLNAPGAVEGYEKLAQGSKTFVNEVCARLMFEAHGPDLIKSAGKVKCPVLFFIAEKDNLVDPQSYGKIQNILKEKLEIVFYPIGHFDIYQGEYFEKSVNKQVEWIKANS